MNQEMDRCEKVEIRLTDEIRERHRYRLKVSPNKSLNGKIESVLKNGISGVIVLLKSGYLTRKQLKSCKKILSADRRLYFYWQREKAIEHIDREKLSSYSRLNWAVRFLLAYKQAKTYRFTSYNPHDPSARRYRLYTLLFRLKKALSLLGIFCLNLIREPWSDNGKQGRDVLGPDENQIHNAEISDNIEMANPVPFDKINMDTDGYGAYIRLDFWAKISSGGSYGHTCYVAKELACSTRRMGCFMANRYSLIDEMGLEQSVLSEPGPYGDEETISRATMHYYPLLLEVFKKKRPDYIYERICIGNWVSVKLSQDLNIPYIVEYNGSEIFMKRSFEGGGYQYEDFYLDCEEAAFRQATAISVVSEIIKDDLVKRGIDDRKIIVNPNGVDLEAYKPDNELKRMVRAELGWSDQHRIIGFTGTFGGWHGVDILAESLAPILEKSPDARFLLIGDGNLKHLIDVQIEKHQLEDRVHCAGRVPQTEGARLLAACDIYVSPHNSHMVDSRFFGSPTKIFEYMAMGGGIVSTDLEQIGEVLSPALRAAHLNNGGQVCVVDERSVLCVPGNVNEFIQAVTFLVKHPQVCSELGNNAREAAIKHYSWEKHVARLLQFVGGLGKLVATPATECLEQAGMNDEFYKQQARKQWDNDPCGSHYVKDHDLHTLEWFQEAERYRYEEYAPWMLDMMEFDRHGGESVIEIGGGMGTDLAQYAKHGARILDFDLAAGHLQHARKNIILRGLQGSFIQGDAEHLPLSDNSFDVAYSNGVLHHIPNMQAVIHEIYRILKPGGQAIVMVYAENSKHYWENIVYAEGVKKGLLQFYSIGEIMSRVVEISESDNSSKPLVKVYTPDRLRKMFNGFENIQISQCQMTAPEIECSNILPKFVKKIPLSWMGKLMGWNLVIKAHKPDLANA